MNATTDQSHTNPTKGKSYWDGTGQYQTEYKTLCDNLVPDSGSAATLHGELIRAITRLSYEYYNNGNCNARERYINGDTYVDDFYDQFIRLIKESICTPETNQICDKLINIIEINYPYPIEEISETYTLLNDVVIHHIINKGADTQLLPEWYIKD